jgi:hypothetical protein
MNDEHPRLGKQRFTQVPLRVRPTLIAVHRPQRRGAKTLSASCPLLHTLNACKLKVVSNQDLVGIDDDILMIG